MKKFQCAALAMCGLLLAGCGADNTDNVIPEIDFETIGEIQSQQEETQAVPESDRQDVVSNEDAEGSIPTIMITQDNQEWYTEDGTVRLLQASAVKVEVTDGFEALNAALSERWSGLQENYDELLQMAKEDYGFRDSEGQNYFGAYYAADSLTLFRSDDTVISFREIFSEYTGGAHGNYGYSGATFDVESGRELELEDILSDAEGFYGEAVGYIADKLEETYGEGLFPEYRDTVLSNTFGEDAYAKWYLNAVGIVIEYDPYVVGPYAMGAAEVILPYGEFADYIKDDYVKPCSSVLAKVPVNEDFSGLIGELGKVVLEVKQEDYGQADVAVSSENASETVGSFGRLTDAYVIKRADGRSFLVFVCDYASDDFVTYVYEVTGGSIRKCDEVDRLAFSDAYMGIDELGFSKQLDVLGTYTGSMRYLLTDDGKLTPTAEVFTVELSPFLTVIRELPVTLEGSETTIAAGTRLRITGTDNLDTAYFQLETGEEGMIKYVRSDEQWQLLIDGVPESDYFEMVPYAG